MSFMEKFTEFIKVAVEGDPEKEEENRIRWEKEKERMKEDKKRKRDDDYNKVMEEYENVNIEEEEDVEEEYEVDKQYDDNDKVVNINQYQDREDSVRPIIQSNSQKLQNHLARPNRQDEENIKRIKRTVYMGLPIEYDMRRNIGHTLEIDRELGLVVNMVSRDKLKFNATLSSEYIIDNITGEILYATNDEYRYSDGLKYLLSLSKERGMSEEEIRELGTKINVLISRRDLRTKTNLTINGKDYTKEVEGYFKKLGVK